MTHDRGKKRRSYRWLSPDGVTLHAFTVKHGRVADRSLCGLPNISELADGTERCGSCRIVIEQSWA